MVTWSCAHLELAPENGHCRLLDSGAVNHGLFKESQLTIEGKASDLAFRLCMHGQKGFTFAKTINVFILKAEGRHFLAFHRKPVRFRLC